jgi:hypothetical protein
MDLSELAKQFGEFSNQDFNEIRPCFEDDNGNLTFCGEPISILNQWFCARLTNKEFLTTGFMGTKNVLEVVSEIRKNNIVKLMQGDWKFDKNK